MSTSFGWSSLVAMAVGRATPSTFEVVTVVNQTEPAAKPFAVFSTRHFGYAWACGLLWHLCRWGVAFLGTYLVNDMTGSPRMVQLAGTVLYAPLLLGGVLGGVISDRFDRLVTVRVQLLALIPAHRCDRCSGELRPTRGVDAVRLHVSCGHWMGDRHDEPTSARL